MRGLLKVLLVLIVLIGLWLAWGLLFPIKPSQPKFVLLKPGWSTRHIANELQANGVIRSAQALLLYHYVMKPRTLKAGEYKFEEAASALAVHDRLARGDINSGVCRRIGYRHFGGRDDCT